MGEILHLVQSHTGCGAKGGEDGSRHGGDDLHDPLDGFLFRHNGQLFSNLIVFSLLFKRSVPEGD